MKKKYILYLALVFALVLQFNIDCLAVDWSKFRVASRGSYSSDNSNFPESTDLTSYVDTQAIVDSSGHYVSGGIFTTGGEPNNANGHNWYLGNQLTSSDPNYNNYFPRTNPCMFVVKFDSDNHTIFDEFGNPLIGYYLAFKHVDNDDPDYQRTCGYVSYAVSNGDRWRGYIIGNSFNTNDKPDFWLYGSEYFSDTASNSDYHLHCNLPIFLWSNSTAIDNYIANGDISGASNKNDINPLPEVPYPLDLNIAESSKTAYGSKFTTPIVVDWYSGQNSIFPYQTMCFNVYYQIIGEASVTTAGATTDYTIDTGIVKAASNVHYRSDHPSYTISTDTLNDAFDLAVFGRNIVTKAKYIQSVTIWIENVDDVMRSNVSEMKYVQYDFKTKVESSSNDQIGDENPSDQDSENGSDGYGSSSGSSSTSGNGVTVNVTQNNNGLGGTSSDSGGTNILDVIVALVNGLSTVFSALVSGVTGAISSVLNVLTGIVSGTSELGSYLQSGFGLLGENGFIGLASDLFSFIPSDIWNLMTTGLSTTIMLSIAGAVLHFIRG